MSTERQMLDMLHARYSFVRRGTTARRYAVAEHVTNTGQTMGSGTIERIADFLAQDTYRNPYAPDGRAATYSFNELRQYVPNGEFRQPLHGHEVKVSRSDWLRELTSMSDDPDPIPPGTQGVVTWVGDPDVTPRQVGVKWDDGRTLMLLHGVDKYRIVPTVS